jgi:hypothetical protein
MSRFVKLRRRRALLVTIVSLTVCVAATGLLARSSAPNDQAGTSSAGPNHDEVSRPADLYAWPTLGTTLRMRLDGSNVPDEMRHVQVEPKAFDRFRSEGEFPDGTTFAVTFYALEQDGKHSPKTDGEPALYAQGRQRFFGLEVLDRRHADGRRFYSFPPDAYKARALPAGNACAACHRSEATVQGVFAQYYPAMRKIVVINRAH